MAYIPKPGKNRPEHYLLFVVDEFTYALPLDWVQRIIPSVLFHSVLDGPLTIRGIINLHRKLFPLVNLRSRFGHAVREIQEEDKFILLSSSRISFAIEADDIVGVSVLETADASGLHSLLPGLRQILPGAGFHHDGLILLYNMEQLFLHDVEKTLDLYRIAKEMKNSKKG